MTDTVAHGDWRAILTREIELHPRGKAGVAERLGVTRCYVSRAMSTGKSAFARVPDKFVARVLDIESDVDCPAQGARVARAECRKALGPCPTSNIIDARLWRDCQSCAIRPIQPEVNP